MIKFICSFLLVLIAFTASSQDVPAIMQQAARLEKSMQDEPALAKYKEALKSEPSNVMLLCKCSELCSRIGARLDQDDNRQGEYFKNAKTYATHALQVDPRSSEANFSMALALSNEASRLSGREKIDAVRNIKKFADLSIFFDKNNFKAWYVLGKWNFAISSLNFMERTAIKMFFKSFPPASLASAISCFEKAKSLNPGFILNYYSLAQAYKKNNQDDLALQDLKVMINLPSQTADDQKIKNEGLTLLNKWN